MLDGRQQTGLIAMATDTSKGVSGLPSYRNAQLRLRARMWGADDLDAFSSHAGRDLTPPFSVVRTLCLLAAAQAGVDAIDAVSTKPRDEEQSVTEVAQARRDGFAAKAAGLQSSH
ncbi:hypothetical protein [Cupriavidus sp. CuC1]|uniref:hypothetical protein n=1 Tax=Cupriavidus sp. CuC1 TaxID=3373131 RepID=UPI0037D3BB5F